MLSEDGLSLTYIDITRYKHVSCIPHNDTVSDCEEPQGNHLHGTMAPWHHGTMPFTNSKHCLVALISRLLSSYVRS